MQFMSSFIEQLQSYFYDILEVIGDAPLCHILIEGCLLVGIVWLICCKSYNPKDLNTNDLELTESEQELIIEEWTPEPLVGDVPMDHPALRPSVVNGKAGKFIVVDGLKCLNMATHNYLGFIGNEEIEASAIKTLHKYGVGSCGPRGFYGTVDVHLELEERLAKFMHLEEAAVYSYGFSTIASAIPAYAKRNDIIFVDENVNFAIQKGLDASRSKIKYFKHNDMKDLERLLIEQKELEKKNPRKALATRHFLVVEGIYMNSGDICPLPQLVALRKQYKLRIFVDENISFGSLGAHGRGVTEYFDVPKEDVDLIVCSMEWSMATIGGFCVGSSFIVEHQRLSGLGYCFSASLPPLLATAAITSLDLMERDPGMFGRLADCCRLVHRELQSLVHLNVSGHQDSPVKHLTLTQTLDTLEEEVLVLSSLVAHCRQNGLALVIAAYLTNAEKFKQRPSIRVTVNNSLTEEDINNFVTILHEACEELAEELH